MEDKTGYFMEVYDWVTNGAVWIGAGPVWQIIGVVLATVTVLQLLSNRWAGGVLFNREALWITLILDALWVFMVFVAAFIPVGATVALVVVVGLVIGAILARNHWHMP